MKVQMRPMDITIWYCFNIKQELYVFLNRGTTIIIVIYLFFEFYPVFSPQFRGTQLLVATILYNRYNSHTGSGETKVESHASSDNPTNAMPIVRRPTDLPFAAGLRQSLGAIPESLVAQLALQNSVLNHCATWEAGTTISLR